MGWLRRLFGGPGAPAAPANPVVTDLVPGKLTARVHAHDFRAGADALPCWTYVTDGFAAVGQKEFVFTLVRGRGDDPSRPPHDPLRFFAQIYSLAEQKQYVEAGGFTCFAAHGGNFLGRVGLVGFAYTRPEPVPGVATPPPDRCLAAVFLLPGEAEWVRGRGAYRVLARLGRDAHYFPHPPWSDSRRAAVIGPDEAATSLLGQMPVAYLGGASVRTFLTPSAVPPAGSVGTGGGSATG